MLKPLLYTAALLTVFLFTSFVPVCEKALTVPAINHAAPYLPASVSDADDTAADQVFECWNLSKAGLNKQAFELAYKGYTKLRQQTGSLKKEILAIIDFSKSSAQKRLFIVNLKTGKLLLKSLVAHGQHSGNEYATCFSNEKDSHQSSLGFYITLQTYTGEHGYSLKLKGCEKGINDAAASRDIVIHAADYVSDEIARSRGFIGRSFGCPAVPEKLHKKIIDLLKNGSCLFVYHPTQKYLMQSEILNG